jgi:CRP-like cAMP-binding protein
MVCISGTPACHGIDPELVCAASSFGAQRPAGGDASGVWAGLAPLLELVPLALGEVLYESGVVQQRVYFPTDCIVSLLYVLENGQSAEIAVVGFEGMVGVSLLMGGGSTPNRAVVQSAGHAFRLGASHIKQLVEQGGALLHLLLRYTQALITQMSQTAVCNRHHSLEQQLCRWLLLSLDLTGCRATNWS